MEVSAMMSLEQRALENFRQLSIDKQAEAVDFLEFLAEKTKKKKPFKSLKGAYSDLNATITLEDIQDIRKEMWADFPRDITL